MASPWYRLFRRWSFALAPLLLGVVFFALAIFLATHTLAGRRIPLVAPGTLLALLAVYLLISALYSAALHVAPSHGAWWAALTLGIAAYFIVTSLLIGGLGAGIVTLCVIGLIAVWYARGHLVSVQERALQITTFAGAHHRALQTGKQLLLPGERVSAILETGEHVFTSPTQRVEVMDGRGIIYVARASVTVAYQVIVREAHQMTVTPENWERALHELVGDVLRHSLTEWGVQMLTSGGSVPDRLLAHTVLRELRERARRQAAHILWVNLHDIWLATEDALDAEIAQAQSARPSPRIAQGTPARTSQRDDEDLLDISDAAHGPSRESLAADVLSEAYEAVREGHINDPETIRQIAKAFLLVAREPDLNDAFPYDASQAAHILIDRALAVEREHQSVNQRVKLKARP